MKLFTSIFLCTCVLTLSLFVATNDIPEWQRPQEDEHSEDEDDLDQIENETPDTDDEGFPTFDDTDNSNNFIEDKNDRSDKANYYETANDYPTETEQTVDEGTTFDDTDESDKFIEDKNDGSYKANNYKTGNDDSVPKYDISKHDNDEAPDDVHHTGTEQSVDEGVIVKGDEVEAEYAKFVKSMETGDNLLTDNPHDIVEFSDYEEEGDFDIDPEKFRSDEKKLDKKKN